MTMSKSEDKAAVRVEKSASNMLGVLSHVVHGGLESIGLAYAIGLGPTLAKNTKPMIDSIAKEGFEKGWAEGPKAWVDAPEGMLTSGIMGRLTANVIKAGIQAVFGKVGPDGKAVAEAMGAFVAVGLQVGAFSGKGLAAIATPAGAGALATYAVASVATCVAIWAIEKPFKELMGFAARASASPAHA